LIVVPIWGNKIELQNFRCREGGQGEGHSIVDIFSDPHSIMSAVVQSYKQGVRGYKVGKGLLGGGGIQEVSCRCESTISGRRIQGGNIEPRSRDTSLQENGAKKSKVDLTCKFKKVGKGSREGG